VVHVSRAIEHEAGRLPEVDLDTANHQANERRLSRQIDAAHIDLAAAPLQAPVVQGDVVLSRAAQEQIFSYRQGST